MWITGSALWMLIHTSPSRGSFDGLHRLSTIVQCGGKKTSRFWVENEISAFALNGNVFGVQSKMRRGIEWKLESEMKSTSLSSSPGFNWNKCWSLLDFCLITKWKVSAIRFFYRSTKLIKWDGEKSQNEAWLEGSDCDIYSNFDRYRKSLIN